MRYVIAVLVAFGGAGTKEDPMSTVTMEEAQAKLPDLIRTLGPGAEVVIMENDRAVARLLPATKHTQRQQRRPGTLRGTVKYMASDFDAALDEFKDYVE